MDAGSGTIEGLVLLCGLEKVTGSGESLDACLAGAEGGSRCSPSISRPSLRSRVFPHLVQVANRPPVIFRLLGVLRGVAVQRTLLNANASQSLNLHPLPQDWFAEKRRGETRP